MKRTGRKIPVRVDCNLVTPKTRRESSILPLSHFLSFSSCLPACLLSLAPSSPIPHPSLSRSQLGRQSE
eukprot:752371-Hanusia_phi.AAC.1